MSSEDTKRGLTRPGTDTILEPDPVRQSLRLTKEISIAPTPMGGTVGAMLEQIEAFKSQPTSSSGVIARGGMASIDVVSEPNLGRRSARKVLHPSLRKDRRAVSWFIREAHITGQLDHPNIVPVHALGIDDDSKLFFTMKLVEGRTFDEIVKGMPKGPIEGSRLFDLIGFLIRVCDALEMAHSRGVIHCDIKPQNIMVGDYGQVYLMDWGIARLVPQNVAYQAQELPAVPVTSWAPDVPADGVSGTPAYMSPEQAAEAELDGRADVFAVGALIFFLLARRAPYTGSAQGALTRAYRWEFPSLAELVIDWDPPRGLVRICERAMAREPVDRYSTVVELRDDLKRFMRGGGAFPIVEYEKGEHVVIESEPADAAYIIETGRCQVYATRDGRHVPIKELGPGEVFGETAILAETTRTASVVALGAVRLHKVTRAIFESEVDEGMQPWMGRFTRALAQRMRDQTAATEAGADRPHPVQWVNLTLMYLETWGERGEDGAVTMTWTRLAKHLQRHFGLGENALAAGLSRYEEFVVDVAADTITLSDAQRLRGRIQVDLWTDAESTLEGD